MNLVTQVKSLRYPDLIDPQDKIISIGSCFSENIGLKLLNSNISILNNPFGVIFNPISIANVLNRALEKNIISEKELVENEGVFSHQDFHGRYNSTSSKVVTQNINKDIDQVGDNIRTADWLIITLGTSIVYELKSANAIVSNCHKLSSDLFSKKILTSDEITKKIGDLIKILKKYNKTKVILTVSPIRHIKDGLIENSRSKARLIESCHELTDIEGVYYFPSFEIMIDELRDYRYYSKDMLHPSELAVEIIMERFSSSFISTRAQDQITDMEKLNQSLSHRPFLPESEAYQSFLKDLNKKIEKLEGKYPHLSFEKEKEKINKSIV